MEPQRAVAFLVLGKASALAGALVAGGYFGFAVMFPDPARCGGTPRSGHSICGGNRCRSRPLRLWLAARASVQGPHQPDEGADAVGEDGLEADTHD